jgi:hypothetical protein
MIEGDRISFTYNGGRKVRCIITKLMSKFMIGKLETDYIGRNEEWEAGELKEFSIKAMKHIKIQPK